METKSIIQFMNSYSVKIKSCRSWLCLFLFAILQLQDYALLAGSFGLIAILAIIMKASQKIRWYAEE